MKKILSESRIVGSDNISVFTGKTKNEASVAMIFNLLINVVGSVRRIVHAPALCVKKAFGNEQYGKLTPPSSMT